MCRLRKKVVVPFTQGRGPVPLAGHQSAIMTSRTLHLGLPTSNHRHLNLHLRAHLQLYRPLSAHASSIFMDTILTSLPYGTQYFAIVAMRTSRTGPSFTLCTPSSHLCDLKIIICGCGGYVHALMIGQSTCCDLSRATPVRANVGVMLQFPPFLSYQPRQSHHYHH